MANKITVDKPCDQFSYWKHRWEKIDDAIEGEIKVKMKRSRYLRPLSGMNNIKTNTNDTNNYDDYEIYLERARWYAAPARSLTMMLGLIARRPVSLVVDDSLEDQINFDINGYNNGISDIFILLCDNLIRYGRAAILVDYSRNTSAGQGRAYIDCISATSIINWRFSGSKLSLIVIKQVESIQDPDDEFSTIDVEVFKVWRLELISEDLGEADPRSSVVSYQRYIKQFNSSTNSFDLIPEEKIYPTNMGSYLTEIPIRFISCSKDQTKIESSPIEPICTHSFTYYRVSADRGWGLHHIALPTPYFTGVSKNQLPNGLGPSIIIALPQGATAGILSYSGEGLGELSSEMTEIKSEIADYGARLLESRGKVGEAADTVELKMMSDSASLSTIVKNVVAGITWSLRLYHELNGRPAEAVSANVDTDFITTKLSGANLTALVNAYLSGAIPLEVMFNNLKEGQIVDSETSYEKFVDDLAETQASQLDITVTSNNNTTDVNSNTTGTNNPGTGT